MLEGVLDMIPNAKVSVVGIARNHDTLMPEPYFERFVGQGGRARRRASHHHPAIHRECLAGEVGGEHVGEAERGAGVLPGVLVDLAEHEGVAVGALVVEHAGAVDVGRVVEQQRTALGAQVAAAEIRLNDPSAKPSELQLLVRTLWHRQSSVGIGGEIPMTTRLGTRLPTSS